MTAANIDQVLAEAESRFRGPGGAIVVLKDGQVIGQRVWGYADLDARIPLTAETVMPICSISKQFFAALLVDLRRNPPPSLVGLEGGVDGLLHDKLKELLGAELVEENGLTVDHLLNMQSGLRDYWACCVPWGAKPESRFGIAEHSALALQNTRSFHFEPGTQYSYCNTNWHIVGRALEQVLGLETLDALLREKIFDPVGMRTARLGADSFELPGPCVGYEGTESAGYVPATNRIEWSGDAGILATLTDMIAYEKYIDRASRDEKSIYHFLARPRNFKDGKPAAYHHGLIDATLEGVRTVYHGGALRGFRLQRVHVPDHRLSVTVMFNHEAAASAAASGIIRKILHLPEATPDETVEPAKAWQGHYLDPATNLVVTVHPGAKPDLTVSFAGHPETLKATSPTLARSTDMTASLEGDLLQLTRLTDNLDISAKRLPPPAPTHIPSGDSLPGDYHCTDIESTLHITGLASAQSELLYASFDGFLGHGPVHLMRPVSRDVWLLACPRSPDAPAPGDWSVVFERDAAGRVRGLTLGCWLARGLVFGRSG